MIVIVVWFANFVTRITQCCVVKQNTISLCTLNVKQLNDLRKCLQPIGNNVYVKLYFEPITFHGGYGKTSDLHYIVPNFQLLQKLKQLEQMVGIQSSKTR